MKNISRGSISGFTLIELLVVVLIIGILSAVALPQYQKAVTKAHFAEAMVNLKSLAQAHKVCYLEKGEGCEIDELLVEVGEKEGDSIYEEGGKTSNFEYMVFASDIEKNIWATAHYKKEDVCLCYKGEGDFLIQQEAGSCWGSDPSMDYAKLLNLTEGEECACC